MIEEIINTTLQSFDFAFCITVNVLTYIIIKILIEARPFNKVSTWTKRLITLISILIVSLAYYLDNADTKLIINSSILAPVFWSWIGKPIMKKLKFDYNNKIDDIDDVIKDV